MANIIHDTIPVPEWLDQIGGNFTGTITISRRFEEHPTAQVSIIASKTEIDTIRQNLRKDFETKYLFYNMPFRLRNYNEQEFSQTVYPEGYYQIKLDFEGFWKKLVTDPLLLREKAFNAESLDEWEAPACGIDNTPEALVSGELAHPYKKDILITYLSTLAERAGVNYEGDGLFAEFPVDASYFASTTLNAELNNLLPTLQKIIKYSKEEGLVTQEWDVATDHELGEEEVIGKITFSVNSQQPEYINTELQWDKFGKEAAALEFEQIELEEVEDTLNNNIPVFDADIPDVYEIVTGVEDDDLETPSEDKLTSINQAWDLSGNTKTQTTTTYEGTNVIQVRELTYGFAFNGIDIYQETGGPSGNPILLNETPEFYWMPVRDLTTVYEYDSSTGYFLGTRTNGFIRNRFRQDRDESGEAKDSSTGTITYTTKIRNDTDFLTKMEMYNFKKMPYVGQTSYLLKQFGDYYEDGRNVNDQYIIYEFCGSDGKLHRGYVIDPTYVEPMFISATDTVVNAVQLKGELDVSEQGSITQYTAKGQESYYSEVIEIFQSEFTKANNNLLGKKIKGEGLDRYRKTIIETNTEGEDLRDYVTNERIEDIQGRPGVASRKPSKFKLRDVQVNNTNATTSITLQRKELERSLKALENLKKQVYLMNTGDNDPSKTAPRGSVFIKTDEQDVAEEGAKFKIEVQEFRSGEQSTLTTFFNQQLEEGDFITFTFNGKTRKRRIINVNHIIDIKGTTVDGTTVVTAATQLTMGVISTLGDDVEITIFDEFGRIVDEENNNPAVDDQNRLLNVALPPYYADKQLGSRLTFSSKRVNLVGVV